MLMKHRYHVIPTASYCWLANLVAWTTCQNYYTEINKSFILNSFLKLFIHDHNNVFRWNIYFYSTLFYKLYRCLIFQKWFVNINILTTLMEFNNAYSSVPHLQTSKEQFTRHIFPLTCMQIHHRLFWCELKSFGDVCLSLQYNGPRWPSDSALLLKVLTAHIWKMKSNVSLQKS